MRLLVPQDASNDMDKHEFNNNDSSSGRISTVRRKSKSYYFDDMSLGKILLYFLLYLFIQVIIVLSFIFI